jgi:hypothetical protein
MNACSVFVINPEGARPPGTRCKWEQNIEMDVTLDGMVWTALIWLRICAIGGLL